MYMYRGIIITNERRGQRPGPASRLLAPTWHLPTSIARSDWTRVRFNQSIMIGHPFEDPFAHALKCENIDCTVNVDVNVNVARTKIYS